MSHFRLISNNTQRRKVLVIDCLGLAGCGVSSVLNRQGRVGCCKKQECRRSPPSALSEHAPWNPRTWGTWSGQTAGLLTDPPSPIHKAPSEIYPKLRVWGCATPTYDKGRSNFATGNGHNLTRRRWTRGAVTCLRCRRLALFPFETFVALLLATHQFVRRRLLHSFLVKRRRFAPFRIPQLYIP